MTYDSLDRMFFEVLRRALVAKGYLPDQTTFTDPVAYDAARATVKANGILIDLYGVGTKDDKGEITGNRITIARVGEHPGSIGLGGTTYFEPIVSGNTTTGFKKYAQPDETKNVRYEVRYMAYDINADRAMATLLTSQLGEKRYLYTVDSTGAFTEEYALVKLTSVTDVSARPDIIEFVWRYNVIDVLLGEDLLISANVPVLTSITYSLYLKPEPATGDSSVNADVNVTEQ